MGPILCGTDFSPLAVAASEVAEKLAHRLDLRLHLVHVQDATEAKAPPGVELIQGTPDEALAEYGLQLRASLLVVGSLGRRSLSDWLLGSTAERLVRGSLLPSLVVRRPQPLLDWLNGSKKLRVLLAVSQDGSAEPALLWLNYLARVGPLEALAVQVAGGPLLNDAWYEAESEKLRRYTGFEREQCRLEVAQWPVEEHLLAVAEQERIDLILMGTRQRSSLERIWRGSVSMAVLRRSGVNVAFAPA